MHVIAKPMFALTAMLTLLIAAESQGATTFRCQDAKGKWYYGDKMPPECAKGPSSELSSGGLTVKTNPGELTPEQKQAEEARKKAAEAERQRVIECQRSIKSLLITYNSVEEIDAARAKALSQANDAIQGLRQKIADTQQAQVDLQKQVDSYKGKKMPADLKESVEAADKDLRNNQSLIILQRKELDAIRKRFDTEKALYLDINSANPSDAATCKAAAKGK